MSVKQERKKELRLEMMGELCLYLDHEPISLLQKEAALLCYLKINGRSFSRRELEVLFWPESRRPQVSLRVALNRLRDAGLAPFLIISAQSIAFNRFSRHWTDVDALDQQLDFNKQAQHVDLIALASAIDACRGAFLAQFQLPDTVQFNLWVAKERERWRLILTEALELLVTAAVNQHNLSLSQRYAARLAQLDPMHALTNLEIFSHSEKQTKPKTNLKPLPAPKKNASSLPRQTTSYTVRKETLQKIQQSLLAQNTVILVGARGSGKTFLATCAAHAMQAQLETEILWIEGTEVSASSMAATETAALIVIDDVTQTAQLDTFIGQGNLLITTCNHSIAQSLANNAVVSLPPLSAKEAYRLLTADLKVPQADPDLLNALCARLFYHPLSIALLHGCLLDYARHDLQNLLTFIDHRMPNKSGRQVTTGVSAALHANLATVKAQQRELFHRLVHRQSERPFSTAEAAHLVAAPIEQVADDLEWLTRRALLRPADNGRYVHHQQILQILR